MSYAICKIHCTEILSEFSSSFERQDASSAFGPRPLCWQRPFVTSSNWRTKASLADEIDSRYCCGNTWKRVPQIFLSWGRCKELLCLRIRRGWGIVQQDSVASWTKLCLRVCMRNMPTCSYTLGWNVQSFLPFHFGKVLGNQSAKYKSFVWSQNILRFGPKSTGCCFNFGTLRGPIHVLLKTVHLNSQEECHVPSKTRRPLLIKLAKSSTNCCAVNV